MAIKYATLDCEQVTAAIKKAKKGDGSIISVACSASSNTGQAVITYGVPGVKTCVETCNMQEISGFVVAYLRELGYELPESTQANYAQVIENKFHLTIPIDKLPPG